jgi:hypothetical protein
MREISQGFSVVNGVWGALTLARCYGAKIWYFDSLKKNIYQLSMREPLGDAFCELENAEKIFAYVEV